MDEPRRAGSEWIGEHTETGIDMISETENYFASLADGVEKLAEKYVKLSKTAVD